MSLPMPDGAKVTTLHQCRTNIIAALAGRGIDTAELDARLLISHALGLEGVAYFTSSGRELDDGEVRAVAELLARRLAGEPVSRIIGRRGFWKHEFVLGAATLDPRPDSETLIETALDLIEEQNRQDTPLQVLDLGTGSGALLLSLLLEWPETTGLGVDRSAEALEIAARNAERLKCADRVRFQQGHWLRDCEQRYDVIVCNPPYIPEEEIDRLAPEVAQYDPREALDGGADGLDPYREIFPKLADHLKGDGVALFEFGVGQHEDLVRLAADAGLAPAIGEDGLVKDLTGRERVLVVRVTDAANTSRLVTNS
jgi:release factor glutamine methyltransferase